MFQDDEGDRVSRIKINLTDWLDELLVYHENVNATLLLQSWLGNDFHLVFIWLHDQIHEPGEITKSMKSK